KPFDARARPLESAVEREFSASLGRWQAAEAGLELMRRLAHESLDYRADFVRAYPLDTDGADLDGWDDRSRRLVRRFIGRAPDGEAVLRAIGADPPTADSVARLLPDGVVKAQDRAALLRAVVAFVHWRRTLVEE